MLLEAAIPTALLASRPQTGLGTAALGAPQGRLLCTKAKSCRQQEGKSEEEFFGTGFRAAGQELSVAYGKTTQAGSADRTMAVEDTYRNREARGRWRTEVLLWIIFPTLSASPAKKINSKQSPCVYLTHKLFFFFFLTLFSPSVLSRNGSECAASSPTTGKHLL